MFFIDHIVYNLKMQARFESLHLNLPPVIMRRDGRLNFHIKKQASRKEFGIKCIQWCDLAPT